MLKICFICVLLTIPIRGKTVRYSNIPPRQGIATKTYDLEVPGSAPIRIIEAEPIWETHTAHNYEFEHRIHKNKSGKDYFTTQPTKTTLSEPVTQEPEHSTVYSPDALNSFLKEYADRLKADRKKFDEDEEGVTEEPINKLASIYLPDKSKSWGLVDTQKHDHPYEDKKGWVSLETVPWSTSKISKWQSNIKDQQKPWDKWSGKPYPQETDTPHQGNNIYANMFGSNGNKYNSNNFGNNNFPGSHNFPDSSNNFPDSHNYPDRPNNFPDRPNNFPSNSDKFPDSPSSFPGSSNFPESSNHFSGPNKYPDSPSNYPSNSNKFPDSTSNYPSNSNKFPDSSSHFSSNFGSGTNNYGSNSNYPSNSNQFGGNYNKFSSSSNNFPSSSHFPSNSNKFPTSSSHFGSNSNRFGSNSGSSSNFPDSNNNFQTNPNHFSTNNNQNDQYYPNENIFIDKPTAIYDVDIRPSDFGHKPETHVIARPVSGYEISLPEFPKPNWHKDQNWHTKKPDFYNDRGPIGNFNSHDQNEDNHDIITDQRPNNFPRPILKPRPNFEPLHNRPTVHPDTHPENGNGEWILLSTTKGYQYPRNKHHRSIEVTPDSIGTRRGIRLTVLPPDESKNVNMTTSHGGMLEVEESFETVEESHKHFSEQLKRGNRTRLAQKKRKKPVRTQVLLSRPVQTQLVQQAKPNKKRPTKAAPVVHQKQDATAVLAAVGAGMVPATMAMLVPFVAGRKKRSFKPK